MNDRELLASGDRVTGQLSAIATPFTRRELAMLRTLALLMTCLVTAAGDQGRIQYPNTRRVDHVDTYFGVEVADPYRWLETDIRESPDVAAWVAAENRITTAYLDAIPERETIRRRLTELANFAQYSSPMKEGGRYYYFKNDGLQNQAVLYRMDTLDSAPRVLLDPNTWSKDGTIALGGLGFSDDGRYVAYARSEAGSDWHTWRIMEIATGKLLDDELRWTKSGTASWSKDGKGFYYDRFEKPARGAEYQSLNFNDKLCYHRVGTPQAADELVYYRRDQPKWRYDGHVTDDGRYLVIEVSGERGDRVRVMVRDLTDPHAAPIDVIPNFEHQYQFVGNADSLFYFTTDADAPHHRLVAIELARPQPEFWTEIVPQTEATLTGASMVDDQLIASYLKDVASEVKIFSLHGKFIRDVALPGIGTAGGFGGKRTDKETFYGFSSIATPPTIYRYDMTTGQSRLLRRAEVKFNPDDFEVKQVFYRSKDGTRIPMFVAYKKGIQLDGRNPTLLYGYGGFNISLPPMFKVTWISWMELGGVYAQPTLRGGGEYGEAWHRAGTKLKKQNVFDDFIAAAEWLIANNYTRTDKLAIDGASNGGLLVGAVMTQRPDLFGACLPEVGVMDMLRFQKFTEGREWVDDYGSSDNPDEFKALLAYSPYHNIKPGTCYPPTLISTADTDDRVVPGHSFKFAARMQHDQACDHPILIRISSRSGHGMGKPLLKRIAEIADNWAFLVKNLGMKVP
jgi:prolyl oligopeptidase